MREERSRRIVRLFADDTSGVHDPYLRRALTLAERGRGATAPNPLVGCVVVSDGHIVGEGYHPAAGQPHAEVFALADAGEAARGAHAYVTLEPCSHHGRTPPCTDALIAAGVSRVIVGMADPTAEAGGGAAVLRAAGIEVDFAQNPGPFAELNRGWLKRLATGTPWVTAKLGLSLDARIAFVKGERASMTGPAGAEVTRTLRQRADAVLVGAATVFADDPALTVRDAKGVRARHQPLRVVLAGTGALPADARVFTDGAAPTLVLVGSPATTLPASVPVVHYDGSRGLAGAMAALGQQGVGEVLVEPGQRLFTALMEGNLIDELVTVTAGGVAGDSGPSMYAGAATPGEDGELAWVFSAVRAGIVGDVSVTVWRPRAEPDEQ